MGALVGGLCKGGSRGGEWVWTLRSEILTFFKCRFLSSCGAAIRLSFFCFFSSWLRFGKSGLCRISHQLPILQIPLLCVWFPCPTMTPCGGLAGGDELEWGGVR